MSSSAFSRALVSPSFSRRSSGSSSGGSSGGSRRSSYGSRFRKNKRPSKRKREEEMAIQWAKESQEMLEEEDESW
tara:strand:+ start:145 stop:369 length:225 start_codon:yes stop_codon:yes gene_type:complete